MVLEPLRMWGKANASVVSLIAAVQEVADLAAESKFDYLVIESTGEAPTLAES